MFAWFQKSLVKPGMHYLTRRFNFVYEQHYFICKNSEGICVKIELNNILKN